jgi:hypothetical protein
MPNREDVERFIEQELAMSLERLEAERRNALSELQRIRRWLKFGAFGFVFLTLLTLGPLGVFVGPLLAACGYFGFAAHYKKRLFSGALRNRFKDEVIRPLIGQLAPGTTYRPEGFVSGGEFVRSGMFQVEPSRYTGDDLVEGVHRDVDIRFSELNVEYTRKNGDKSEQRPLFKGLFFVADFHKHFHGFTIVRPRRPRLVTTYLSGASRAEKMNAGLAVTEQMMSAPWSPGSSRHFGLEEVELEDPEFMEYFEVFSTDQVEARYILSPSMMQRLLAFRREAVRAREEFAATVKSFRPIPMEQVENGRFYVSFAASNVYIAKHHYRDLFELDPERPLTDRASIAEYAADLSFAFDIVEDLNLNTRIWSKAPAGR